MRRTTLDLVVVALFAAIISTWGCGIGTPDAGAGAVAQTVGVVPAQSGPASVRFAVQVDGGTQPDVRWTVRGSKKAATRVTFVLQGIKPGPNAQVVASITKTVDVGADGTAAAVFDNVEAVPTIGRVQLENGTVMGFTDFHGAKDLTAGNNVVTVNPNGSALKSDLTAHVLEKIMNSPQLLQAAPNNLTDTVAGVVNGLDRRAATAFDDAEKGVVNAFAPRLTNMVSLAIANSGAQLNGTGAATWNTTPAQMYTQGDLWSLPITEFVFKDVLRQGLDGFGYVSCGHTSLFPFAIAKLNATNGERQAYVRNRGQCKAMLVMSDRSVVVGGTNVDLGCPVLFRWNGTGNAHTFSDADGVAEGLTWARYFQELRGTSAEQTPAVLTIQYDGSKYLLAAVRDAANQATRHYRIDPDTGEVRGSLLPLVTTAATGTPSAGAPPQIVSLSIASYTDNMVTVNWTTDQDTSAQIEYGLTDALGSATVNDSVLGKTHSVTIANLRPSTGYYLRAVSTNAGDLTARSPITSLVTSKTPEAPVVISGVTGTAQGETTLVVTWTTDKDATSQVKYGYYDDVGSYTVFTTPLDRTALRNHSVTINGLTGGRTYTYFVSSIDANNNEAVSTTRNVTMPDETPPVISNVVASVTATWATITWDTNEPADHFIRWGETTAYGVTTTVSTTKTMRHSVFISGLPPQSTFHYQIRCKDAANLTRVSSDNILVTQSLPALRNIACMSGYMASAVLKEDGSVWATGWHLPLPGASSTVSQVTLAQVPNLGPIASLSAWGQALAVQQADGVWKTCDLEGYTLPPASGVVFNSDLPSGQVGIVRPDGTAAAIMSGGDGRTPVLVQGLSGVKNLLPGAGFSVAVKRNGTVWAWGVNDNGQLGDGTTTSHGTPAMIADLPFGEMVAACPMVVQYNGGPRVAVVTAVQSDGTVYVWGGVGGPGGSSVPVAKTTKVPLPKRLFSTEQGVWALLGDNGEYWQWATSGEPTRVSAGILDLSLYLAIKNDGTVWTREIDGSLTPIAGW